MLKIFPTCLQQQWPQLMFFTSLTVRNNSQAQRGPWPCAVGGGVWAPAWSETARSSRRPAWSHRRGACARGPAGTVHAAALGGPTLPSHWGETQHRYWPVCKQAERGGGEERKERSFSSLASWQQQQEMKRGREVKLELSSTVAQAQRCVSVQLKSTKYLCLQILMWKIYIV